jgi:hypothetical protein
MHCTNQVQVHIRWPHIDLSYAPQACLCLRPLYPLPACLAPNKSCPQDLNYRINGGNRVVNYLLRTPFFRDVLHANDQLALQQRKGAVFQVCRGKGYNSHHDLGICIALTESKVI